MSVRVNLGCGRSPQQGWVNLDVAPLPGVDVIADLDRCRTQSLPFGDSSVSELRLSHVLEHIREVLPLMQELHRIAEPGALLTIRSPYGSSDDAYEDPTHCQRLFMNTFQYFGQPIYWRADYGYRGDWEPMTVTLLVARAQNEGLSAEAIMQKVAHLRNMVLEVVAVLKAVKPIRPPDRSLLSQTQVAFQLV